MAYLENLSSSPMKVLPGNLIHQSMDDFNEPLDFSTRKEQASTPDNRSYRITTPESGVSSLGAGSPFRMSPERDSPSRPHAFPFSGNILSQPVKPDISLEMRMAGSPDPKWNFFNSVNNQMPDVDTVLKPSLAHPPQLPSILNQLQQTHPFLLSTLCSLASQRVAEMTSSSPARPLPIPQMQTNKIPQPIPPAPFMGFPMGPVPGSLPHNIPPLDLIHTPPLRDFDEDNLALRSNDSYLKFRAQMIAKGQIGTKTRRNHVRINNITNQNSSKQADPSNSGSGSDDSCEKAEKRTKEDPAMLSDGSQGDTNGSHKEQLRNAAYYERRKKNNEAAKRSRDARRAKEDEIAIRAAFLENENIQLRNQVSELKATMRRLYQLHGV